MVVTMITLYGMSWDLLILRDVFKLDWHLYSVACDLNL